MQEGTLAYDRQSFEINMSKKSKLQMLKSELIAALFVKGALEIDLDASDLSTPVAQADSSDLLRTKELKLEIHHLAFIYFCMSFGVTLSFSRCDISYRYVSLKFLSSSHLRLFLSVAILTAWSKIQRVHC